MYKTFWFVTNIFFVAALVSTLFLHRAVTIEKTKEDVQQNYNKLNRLITVRTLLIVGTILFFVSMCASFLADMHTNG